MEGWDRMEQGVAGVEKIDIGRNKTIVYGDYFWYA